MKNRFFGFLWQHQAHFISWGFFILYEVLMVGVVSGKFGSFWDYFVHYTLNILLFYLHATVVLPLALQQRPLRYWLAPFLVTGEVLLYIALLYTVESLITQLLSVQLIRPLVLDYFYFLRSTWRAVYFIGFATGYYYLIMSLREKRRAEFAEKLQLFNIIENQKLQNELIKSQNAFLKSQINPHFLFNTLNYVYNSVRKTSTQAAEAIMSLSQMMRYALQNENEHQETDLLEEIEQVEHLMRIHQIRHKDELQVKLTYGQNLAGIKFIPLVLITLVENVYKHGDLTRQGQGARIDIIYTENMLRITTVNLKIADQPTGHRIGLDNIRKRLVYAYKERALFEAYADEQGYFHTVLQVDLQKDPSLKPSYICQLGDRE